MRFQFCQTISYQITLSGKIDICLLSGTSLGRQLGGQTCEFLCEVIFWEASSQQTPTLICNWYYKQFCSEQSSSLSSNDRLLVISFGLDTGNSAKSLVKRFETMPPVPPQILCWCIFEKNIVQLLTEDILQPEIGGYLDQWMNE